MKNKSLYTLSVLLGIGNCLPNISYYLVGISAALLIISLIFSYCEKENDIIISRNQIVLVMGTLVFALTFWLFANHLINYKGQFTGNPTNWWIQLVISILLASLIGLAVKNVKYGMTALALYCLSTSLVSGSFVLYTVFNQKELLAQSHVYCYASKQPIAAAGVCNILGLFSIFYSLYIFTYKRFLMIHNWIILITSYALVTYGSFMCQKRSGLICIYILVPILIMIDRYSRKNKINTKSILIILCSIIGLLALYLLFMILIGRPLNLFQDPRFYFMKLFINQLIHDPLSNAVFSLEEQRKWGVWWFHNFFADVHRSSGFIPFIFSIILAAYIGIRLFKSAITDRENSALFYFYITILFLLSSSVVPEGEWQPLILLVMIGSINEAISCRLDTGAYKISRCRDRGGKNIR